MTATLREMTRAECMDRLETGSLGRVVFTEAALPAVRPVNYVLLGSRVVFRTTAGGALARACRSAVVAFEVDDLSSDESGGWSVVVLGVARPLDGSDAVRAVEAGLASAADGERNHFVAITIGEVTGRTV